MEYTVKMSAHATQQILEAVSYISKSLREPETAKRWTTYLQKEISALDRMPARYPLTDQEPWRSKGIRRMMVKSFIVYYLILEDDKTVWITAVIYGRRDQINALQNMPMESHTPM